MSETRRDFILSMLGTACGFMIPDEFTPISSKKPDFSLQYILGSCMYGCMDLAKILPEVAKTGAGAIDIWPMVHGNQRK